MANVAWLVNAVDGVPLNSGRTVRQAMSVALGGATAARPLGARSGVRPGTPASTVALPTATSYVIHPHAGVLDTQASAIAGPYLYVVGSDGADETGTVNAAHGTWPRKDILWVRIDDPSEAGTDPPAIVTGYTAGVAATPGTQVPPATPAQAMRLATISVPLSGGGAPTIVFDAPLLETGIVPCRNTTERDALTAGATADNPTYADVAGVLWTCNDATTWRPMTPVLPHLRIKQAAAQSRPGTSWGQVAFGTTADTAGSQPWTESAGAVTLTVAGLYSVEVTVSTASAAFAVMIYDATSSATLAQSPTGSSAYYTSSVSTTRRLAAGASVLVRVYPTSTTNVAADAASTPTFLSITKLSD